MEQFAIFLSYSSISICLLFQVLLVSLKRMDLRAAALFLILLDFQLIFIALIIIYTANTALISSHLHWLGIELFSLGPLCYLYIKNTYEHISKSISRTIWHFSPLILFIIASIIWEFNFLSNDINQNYNRFLISIFILGSLHLLFYLGACLFYLQKTRQILKNVYGSLKDKDLQWFKNFILGISSLILLELLLTGINSQLQNDEISVIAILAYSFFVWYFTLQAFSQKKVPVTKIITYTPNYNLDLVFNRKEEIADLKKKLFLLFEKDKIYQSDNLSLGDVAKKLNITEKQLSSFLNDIIGTNFYEFVNKFRVSEVIDQIKRGQSAQYTLLGLAYNSGFNSKASFNRVFKKVTGSTPSNFVKSHSK